MQITCNIQYATQQTNTLMEYTLDGDKILMKDKKSATNKYRIPNRTQTEIL